MAGSDPASGPSGVGLVLEGGGMRAAYTGGVLDAFLDEGITLPYVIGVSAGANTGSDYIAEQRERNYKVFVELADDPRYAGWGNVLRGRGWFGMDFLFQTLPDELVPFDYQALARTPRKLVVAVTDCATGLPRYFCQHDYDSRWFIHNVHRASSSIPLLAPPVKIEGHLYLDGGVSDPIPIARSIVDGNHRNVVVLTQNAGYRKSVGGAAKRLGIRLAFWRYPGIDLVMLQRSAAYNTCLDRLAELEASGQVFILRPKAPLTIGRMERDPARLDALYRQGYAETLERLPALREWLTARG